MLTAMFDVLVADTRDDGIDALYQFSSLDVWAVRHSFFGYQTSNSVKFRVQDLGRFEEFKKTVSSQPYDVLLRHTRRTILAALSIGPDAYVARVRFDAPRREPVTLVFNLSRSSLASELDEVVRKKTTSSWMVDSILVEVEPSDPSLPSNQN